MKTIGLLFAALLISLGVMMMRDQISTPTTTPSHSESAYDRVMRTGTLRCGYADWPPIVFYKNMQTGKLSGIAYDLTEELGKRLNLKIEWAEDTSWSNIISGLQSKKMDAFCAMLGVTAERGRYVTYSVPVLFSPAFPFVREDDRRFDDDIMAANDPSVRFSSIDGEMSDSIARNRFPKAKVNAVPQTLQVSESLNNIVTNKADIIIVDYGFGQSFIDNNPGTLRRIGDKPFAVVQGSYAFDLHETMLRDMINSALVEMQNHGIIDQIIAKYTSDPLEILQPAQGYKNILP
ncbi:MAG: substrate-binding periplasmic protein [Bdellovibrionales bacterium]